MGNKPANANGGSGGMDHNASGTMETNKNTTTTTWASVAKNTKATNEAIENASKKETVDVKATSVKACAHLENVRVENNTNDSLLEISFKTFMENVVLTLELPPSEKAEEQHSVEAITDNGKYAFQFKLPKQPHTYRIVFSHGEQKLAFDVRAMPPKAQIIKRSMTISNREIELHNVFGLAKEPDCVICLSEKATNLILPCKHNCVCKDCCASLFSLPEYDRKCPLCRNGANSFLALDINKS